MKVKNLYDLKIDVGDVPNPGSVIKKGRPVCCVYEEGKSNADVSWKMKRTVDYIKNMNNIE